MCAVPSKHVHGARAGPPWGLLVATLSVSGGSLKITGGVPGETWARQLSPGGMWAQTWATSVGAQGTQDLRGSKSQLAGLRIWFDVGVRVGRGSLGSSGPSAGAVGVAGPFTNRFLLSADARHLPCSSTAGGVGDTWDLRRLWGQMPMAYDLGEREQVRSSLLYKKGNIHGTYHLGKVRWFKYIHTYQIFKTSNFLVQRKH